jgi:hypothetical protein
MVFLFITRYFLYTLPFVDGTSISGVLRGEENTGISELAAGVGDGGG